MFFKDKLKPSINHQVHWPIFYWPKLFSGERKHCLGLFFNSIHIVLIAVSTISLTKSPKHETSDNQESMSKNK